MKKIVLLLLALGFISTCVWCQRVVKVKNGTELLEAIAANTTIELVEGNYELPIAKKVATTYVSWDESYSNGYVVSNAENLTIVGKGKLRTHIFIKDRTVAAITFKLSPNLVLQNLKVGHQPASDGGLFGCGGFQSPVLNFEDMEAITINNCGLYGCGNWAILGYRIQSLSVNNSDIYECNVGLVRLSICGNVKFTSCKFNNNTTGTYGQDHWFAFYDCNVVLDKCEVSNNSFRKPVEKDNPLTYDEDIQSFVHTLPGKDEKDKENNNGMVEFRNCKFSNNKFTRLTNNPTKVKFVGSKPS